MVIFGKTAAQDAAPSAKREEADKPWIGFDLDGTLAKYDGWKGLSDIGEPIDEMVARVKRRIRSGERVKIFTARVSEPSLRMSKAKLADAVKPIEDWCEKHIGRKLEVTCVKDCFCKKIYDDIAEPVVKNEGIAE